MSTTQVGSIEGNEGFAQGSAGAISYAVSKPSGVALNDVLVAVTWSCGGDNSGNGANPTGPGDWTSSIGTTEINSSFFQWHCTVFTKVATGSEPSTYTFGCQQGNTNIGLGYGAVTRITAWRGRPGYVNSPWAALSTAAQETQALLTGPITMQKSITLNQLGRVFCITAQSDNNVRAPSSGPTLTQLFSYTTSNPFGPFNCAAWLGTREAVELGTFTESYTVNDPRFSGHSIGLIQLFDPISFSGSD